MEEALEGGGGFEVVDYFEGVGKVAGIGQGYGEVEVSGVGAG